MYRASLLTFVALFMLTVDELVTSETDDVDEYFERLREFEDHNATESGHEHTDESYSVSDIFRHIWENMFG
ncbi:hypothetical protein EG68_01577 [Paragonimus skrjabini miyazakii]|uniref:Uncharacterized protein n=1 Tax=Paragonimus skrjabini miyazakii TaxID=59628 RepID=A0A8S9Z8V0_9TREM|nr:hypothetical protein EG68_01577 [Paragonimus skrjabini miyazakii]